MSGIFGALGIAEYQADQVYIQTVGYELVYSVTQDYVTRYNADLSAAMAAFVERTTDQHSLRYKLPGGGRLDRRGGQARSAAGKAYGKWDVSLPIEDFGRQLAENDIAMAYMTAAEYQRHVDSVLIQNTNTVRFEILKAILNNTARTFNDETLNTPTLTIQPLANGDSVTYPPVLGSESEATDDHYLESNYAASAISDTNNPFVTGANELEEHFGAPSGGSNIVAFVNNAQSAKAQALTNFVPITGMGVAPGAQTATLTNIPPELAAGNWRILGREEGAGTWVVEWRWIPANYIVFVHLDAPKPLLKRVDPAATGLGTDLQLVAEDMDYPFKSAHWRNRFGFGAGNRLNGVVLELGTGGSYSIPSGYS